MTSNEHIKSRLLQGDATELLKRLPAGCIDLVVADPPYLANFRDRTGRTFPNDCSSRWLKPAFAEIARVMKPNSLCVCFYGWPRAEEFLCAWKAAGLRPVGHIVWTKPYISRRHFVAASHEQAYLLAKGNPPEPEGRILRDVLPFPFSGNALHPCQKHESVIRPLIEAFSRRGDLVLDPFAGSATTAVAARRLGRRYLAIELDPHYYELARQRLTRAV